MLDRVDINDAHHIQGINYRAKKDDKWGTPLIPVPATIVSTVKKGNVEDFEDEDGQVNPANLTDVDADESLDVTSKNEFDDSSNCSSLSESDLPSYFESGEPELDKPMKGTTFSVIAPSNDTLPDYSRPNDSLPSYSPTLTYNGISLMKTEFISPYHANSSRNWQPVYLQLNSTQLKIYKISDKNLAKLIMLLYFENNGLTKLMKQVNSGRVDMDENDDAYQETMMSLNLKSKFTFNQEKNLTKLLGKYYHLIKNNQCLFEPGFSNDFKYRGELLHCYTLSNLSLGEAPSLNHLISAIYKEDQSHYNLANLVKYKNVIRVRIEMQQILLQFWSFSAMINWYRNLLMGKDLSMPLENRLVSRIKSIPSRYSRRNNELLAATAAAALYNDTHQEILRIQENLANIPAEKDSDSDSVFTRRGSVSTYASTIEDLSEISISGYKFFSCENHLTTLEKQYISNCIPDLNSYDSWCGKVLTISNYQEFLPRKMLSNDIFINYSSLPKLITNYKQQGRAGKCRQFLIHKAGLVSLPKVN